MLKIGRMAAEMTQARVIGGWCGAALVGIARLSAPAMAESSAKWSMLVGKRFAELLGAASSE